MSAKGGGATPPPFRRFRGPVAEGLSDREAAMAIVRADVVAFAPQFTSVATAVVDRWLTMARRANGETTLGDDWDEAVLLWTCHKLQSSQGSAVGAAGPITSMKSDDVEVSWASLGRTTATSGDDFGSTEYGRTYLDLAKRKKGGSRAY